MSRKHKKKSTDSVELNLAAMLDMAFQLLAFFTITFRPAPAEVEVQMHLPKPVKTDLAVGRSAGEDFSKDDVVGKKTLVLAVVKKGQEEKEFVINDEKVKKTVHTAQYQIEFKGQTNKHPTDNLDEIEKALSEQLGDAGSGFEQVIISGDPALQYGEVMKVVERCSKIRTPDGKTLSKISVVSMQDPPKKPK